MMEQYDTEPYEIPTMTPLGSFATVTMGGTGHSTDFFAAGRPEPY